MSHPVCSRASSGDCYPQAGFSLRREGCPPSRGPPGCPAFGCSSWPGRWLEGQARAAEERRLPSPAASHPRPPARGFTRAGPPLLTHHSPARRLATECWSRNRASGKGQEQRFLGPSGTFCAFPTLRVCPHRLSSLGKRLGQLGGVCRPPPGSADHLPFPDSRLPAQDPDAVAVLGSGTEGRSCRGPWCGQEGPIMTENTH